jgi:serine/threonine-protein kinase RsbW
VTGVRGLELGLPASAENVAVVRHAVAGLAEAMGMDPPGVADLKTIVTEACMNVVIHAYEDDDGPLSIEAHRDGEELEVIVRDQGAGIRPRADTGRQSLRLGLPLIAALSSGFAISGGPGRGTEVTMRMELSPNGDEPAATAAQLDAAGAVVAMPTGELVAPVLARIISIYAVRANFSVDRLSDAVLLCDAISAHADDHFPEETARVFVDEQDGTVMVRVGPLVPGAGDRLLGGMRIPEIDASLERLADEIHVERGDDGEHLVIRIKQPAFSD